MGLVCLYIKVIAAKYSGAVSVFRSFHSQCSLMCRLVHQLKTGVLDMEDIEKLTLFKLEYA